MIGLYSHDMHDFVVRECEIGARAAGYEDMERCGFNALDDVMTRVDAREHVERTALLDVDRSTLIGWEVTS